MDKQATVSGDSSLFVYQSVLGLADEKQRPVISGFAFDTGADDRYPES